MIISSIRSSNMWIEFKCCSHFIWQQTTIEARICSNVVLTSPPRKLYLEGNSPWEWAKLFGVHRRRLQNQEKEQPFTEAGYLGGGYFVGEFLPFIVLWIVMFSLIPICSQQWWINCWANFLSQNMMHLASFFPHQCFLIFPRSLSKSGWTRRPGRSTSTAWAATSARPI